MPADLSTFSSRARASSNKATAAKIVTKAVAESPLRHAVKRMESRFCSAVTKRIATEKGARTVPEQESRKKQAQK